MIQPSQIFELAEGLSTYQQQVCRIVETQEYAGTLSLVDNLDEQSVLESILDDYKPPYPQGTRNRHYLISSPFRYPPLDYGSRFGTQIEPSYFYASETVEACLAEAAFYRFMLLEGVSMAYNDTVTSKHDLFYVETDSNTAVDLCAIKDDNIQQTLKHPSSYVTTQSTGKYCREKGVDLIRFYSARSKNEGVNVAIDNHKVITSTTPLNVTPYICELDCVQNKVRFSTPRVFPLTFNKSQYEVNGHFPQLG